MALTPEQYEARKSGIGASEVAAVLGLSSWAKKIDVYAEKRGLTGPVAETEAMEIGSLQEPTVAELFRRRTGGRVITVSEFVRTDYAIRFFSAAERDEAEKLGILRNDKTAPLFASCDRFAEFADGLVAVELKSVGLNNAWKWGDTGTDKYPVEYWIQVQAQLAVTGLATGYLCALIGNEFRYYRIERDDVFIRAAIDKIKTFWDNHVMTGEAPGEIDDSPAWRLILKERFPEAAKDKKAVETISDDDPVMSDAVKAARLFSEGKKWLETAKTKLQERIGNGRTIRNALAAATLVSSDKPTTKTDWKALAMSLGATPEQIKNHTTAGEPRAPYVKLTIKGEDDNESAD